MPRAASQTIGVLVSCVLAAGCGKKPPEPVAIKGTLKTHDGKPVGPVVLIFHPQEDANKASAPNFGTDAKDGTFSGQTLPGRYKVTAAGVPRRGTADPATGTLPDPGGGQKGVALPASVQSPATTPWEVTVPPGGKDDLQLVLPRN